MINYMASLKTSIKNNYKKILTLVALILFFVYAMQLRRNATHTDIKIGQNTIYAQIADTKNKQSMGLSYTKDLATSTGMLFIFDEIDEKNFWMKDMNYDLDIIWIDESKTVTGFFERVPTDSYNKKNPEQSKIYHSPENTKYVLEVPANTIKNLKIKVGDVLDFKY